MAETKPAPDPKPSPNPDDRPNPTPPPADESPCERDNRELAERRDANAAELADHDGIGGKGRMPDAQALTRPGPGDYVPDADAVVDPDRPSNAKPAGA